jgi:flavin reductase (DIM6/NTAB) family NADH-FMN oxidoreductase RutF
METVSTQDFVHAMGLHVSSVCVITTVIGHERFGLTATAVSSVCANPPRLLVCINMSGVTYSKITETAVLCVNVVAEGQDNVAKAFAGMMGKDFDRFSLGNWSKLKTGSPVLEGATTVFDCRVVQSIPQHSHMIFICEVLATQTKVNAEPLLYGNRKFRNLRQIMPSKSTNADVEDTLHF